MKEPYYSFNSFLRKKYNGQKVRKIPINAGFNCPNKDGTVSSTGCIFCDRYGSGPIRTYTLSIEEQIQRFMESHRGMKYLAYYQAHCNTHAPLPELRKKYEIIFGYRDIVGLFIGTRPDAVADETYTLLGELNQRIYTSVELGLQSVHEKSLEYLNRHHTYRQFQESLTRLQKLNIDVVVHLILGIPGETRRDMLKTIREMNRLRPTGIKFHLFHVLKNTPLERMYREDKFPLMEQEEYVELLVTLLEHLDPGIVIHRLTGERDKEIFVAPAWALDKIETINAVRSAMIRRRTRQGKKYQP